MNNIQQSSSPKPSVFAVVTALGLALIVLSGAVYGHYSRRWGAPPDLAVAAKRLESFPDHFGDWRLKGDHKMRESTIEMLECAGYVNRTYVNATTGDRIDLAVTVGPPGPIAVHTPEICYSSQGFAIKGSREAARFTDGKSRAHHFWNTHFEKRDVFADRMSVYYAWSDGGEWIASRSPRFEFAAAPCLYKLQLSGTVSKQADQSQDDPPTQFINEFLKSGWTPDES